MTSSFVGSERSCLRFTRPGGRGVPATAFSNKSAKHPSPESRRGASPGCFQSATRACRVFSYTQLSRKVCIRDRNRTCIQNGASISYARIYICYSKNCSSLSGSTSLRFSIRFGTGRSQTANSSCSCSRLSLSPPFPPRSPRARGSLAPAPAPRGTPYPHQEICGDLLPVIAWALAHKALYCLTTWLEPPNARCKIVWGFYGCVRMRRVSQAFLRVGTILR